MSKAEDRALEEYPIESHEMYDDLYKQRNAYIKGYHQAEKDLKLTWEDISKILSISEQLKISWWFKDNEQTKQIGTKVFLEEVLKQFKNYKNGNNLPR